MKKLRYKLLKTGEKKYFNLVKSGMNKEKLTGDEIDKIKIIVNGIQYVITHDGIKGGFTIQKFWEKDKTDVIGIKFLADENKIAVF